MNEQSMIERIKALGEYGGPTDLPSIIKDVFSVATTLTTPYGGDYCWCQSLPCECVGKLLDDMAECLEARHPELKRAAEEHEATNRENGSTER